MLLFTAGMCVLGVAVLLVLRLALPPAAAVSRLARITLPKGVVAIAVADVDGDHCCPLGGSVLGAAHPNWARSA